MRRREKISPANSGGISLDSFSKLTRQKRGSSRNVREECNGTSAIAYGLSSPRHSLVASSSAQGHRAEAGNTNPASGNQSLVAWNCATRNVNDKLAGRSG